MTEKNEKFNFFAQGVVIVAISFLIAKAMISEFTLHGVLSSFSIAIDIPEFWHTVVIPLVCSPFYFVAAHIRKYGQPFKFISKLYAVSFLLSIYMVFWGMPLVGIYLAVTTFIFYIYAYRAIHS